MSSYKASAFSSRLYFDILLSIKNELLLKKKVFDLMIMFFIWIILNGVKS